MSAWQTRILWIYQWWDQVPKRIKHSLLTGETNLRYLALSKLFLSNTVYHVHKFSQVRNWLSFCLMKEIPLVGLLEQETQELP